MRSFISEILKRNAYFILAAAWLFTIAFIINNYWVSYSSVEKVRNGIEKRLHKIEDEVKDFTTDKALQKELLSENPSEQTINDVVDKPFGVYLFTLNEFNQPELRFWNTQTAIPDADLLSRTDTTSFVKLSNGQYEFIKTQTVYDGKPLIIAALIPIRKEYFIENNNLAREIEGFPEAEKKVALTTYQTDYPVYSQTGNVLFYLEAKRNTHPANNNNWLSLTFMLIGIAFLMFFINNAAHSISNKYDYKTGIGFLLLVILLLRGIVYLFPGLLNLRQFMLFDPTIYSSSVIFSSLGDLLINAFLFCWIVLFVRREIGDKDFMRYVNTIWQWPLYIINIFLYVATTFAVARIIQSLIADARISFNVTNFFSILNQYSFAGFVVLAAITFGYFFLSQVILKVVQPLSVGKPYVLYLSIAIAGLVLLSIVTQTSFVELNIYVLIWLLFYTWLQNQTFLSELGNRFNISQVIFWLFIFSMSVASIIIEENTKIEIEQRKRTAEKLALQADPSSERLLSIVLTYVDNNFLYGNFERFRMPISNAYLKDSLINKNFSAYLDRYNNHIYTFDESEKPLFNEGSVSYDTLNTIFQIEGKPTAVNDLRYFERAFDKYSYISKKTVTDTLGNTVGYFFMLSDPKFYKSDALVPELFKQRKDFLPNEYSPLYSYAIYNNRELLTNYNDYPFPTQLDSSTLPKNDFTQVRRDGYDELWYRDNNKVVVIAKNNNYFIEAITLFAYLFSAFILLVALFRIIALIIQSGLRWKNLKPYWQLSLRSQIHGTIIFISLFSFLVIGIATIFFFINRYNQTKQDRLTKAIQTVNNEIQNRVKGDIGFRDIMRLYKMGIDKDLEDMISRVSEIHGADINLYSLEGDLKISSNPFIYNKGILSSKMNPLAYYNVHNKKLVQYVNQERMGGVDYQSVYCPLRDDKGEAYAYLNIPSFDTQTELKREISNFLVTIINLNAFIFLIAGIIALVITNRITSYFTLIGNKMKEINLGTMNEEITWSRDNEIGGLVKEYNKMVKKLEESAAALAKSEREGAWREMAKQVAHEIKNPLTPMKLSIQYLQKAIDNNMPNVKEHTANVARTLVEQIDHLSKIASDFSQFANIGNVRNEVFNLNDVLSSLGSLYEKTENFDLSLNLLPNRIYVLADKTQLNRLFTNLLQNAVEACSKEENPQVIINEEIADDKVIITVKDNGEGIPADTRAKIFIPNFTTKSSGTGLGLAMSKSIAEHARGNIWFETAEGVGTTFFVELPIVRMVD